MAEVSYFTKEGLENLKQELHDLKTKKRAEIAKAIAEAREKGDLSENAEYDAAKDAQGLLELNISRLEAVLLNARVVDDTNTDTSKVYILTKVQLRNTKNNQVVTYQLVSAKEADLKLGRISVDSPIGKGLLGHAKGEIVTIHAPATSLEFEILDITR